MVTNPLFWILLLLGPTIYWLAPARFRMGILAVISAGYVASISRWGIVALGLLMLLAWVAPADRGPAGRSATRVRLVVAALLVYLAWFKYVPELFKALAPESSLASIALPVGISFFTFKLIHVAVEISRGNLRDRTPASFAAYVFLFPIFTAGPIEQYDHFLKNRSERFAFDDLVNGTGRIMIGLVKKFLVAEFVVFDILMGGQTFADFHHDLARLPTGSAWIYLFLAFIYGYFDFAGYSDIAIGASRLFGIRIMENFDNPMLSKNIAEFWKRWHMSLAAWTQRYVYMPTLGLTRNPWVGIYLTFLAMGLWHAGNASFVCWGLYHATGVSAALLVQRARRSRGGRPFAVIDRIPRWGTALTWVFLAGSAGFAASSGSDAHVLLRVFAKLVGIDVTA